MTVRWWISQGVGHKAEKIMRKIEKIVIAAVAAIAAVSSFASCGKSPLTPEERKISFGAVADITNAGPDPDTRATLTTNSGEKVFTSAWENGDGLSIQYSDGTTDGTMQPVWDGSAFTLADTDGLPTGTGNWTYRACYPVPEDGACDFGSSRTQSGNAYNSRYDIMQATPVSVTDADFGKSGNGKDITFGMNRKTAVVYFHLTDGPDEEVVSATLEVTGGYIAKSSVPLTSYEDGYNLENGDLTSITTTFAEGSRPRASDLRLWFNVLPTDYTKMTLTVRTSSQKLVLSNSTSGAYEAGKLYKVVQNISSKTWTAKTKKTFTETIGKIPLLSGEILP